MKKIFLSLLFVCACAVGFAQQLFNQDLSTINVDKITDAEITYYYNKLQQNNISIDEAAQIAAAKGMPADQIAKLRARLQNILIGGQSNTSSTQNNNVSQLRQSVTDSSYSARQLINDDSLLMQNEKPMPQIFGSELFSSSSLSFQPNLRIPTPVNYSLGADDELNIDVFGFSEQHYQLTVTTEGNIIIPNVGPIFVSGLTVAQAALKIKAKLAATIYKAINTGNTDVQVSLGNIKSIQVTIIGEAKKPGTYTVSSLSTVFNALYLCGGPDENGSYRSIELIRNNVVIKKIDLYDFLLRGNQINNVGLMDGDVIHIPYYALRATLDGEIKHPAIYELLPETNLQQLLDYAGSFTDSAYKASVKITSLTDKERKVEDVASADFATYHPQSSDLIEVGKILDRYTNRVTINGAVMRPGDFELTQGLTLKQLIEKADGLREDAFTQRGTITRQKEDLTPELISFNLVEVLNNPQSDIVLKKEDVIQVSSVYDLRDTAIVTIQGEVRMPKVYYFQEGMTLKDLIFEAGGFTEAATAKKIEIASRIKEGDPMANSSKIAEILEVNTEKDLDLNDKQYRLHSSDVIIVRNNPGYFIQKTVTVRGEVLYPGAYVIKSNDEKISSIVNRSGGFKSTANPSAASLLRVNLITEETKIKSENIEKLANFRSDTSFQANSDSLKKEAAKPYDLIGINLNEIMQDSAITNNLILEDGDILFIPKKNQAVKVRGEVLYPSQFAFQIDKNMKYYIDQAGGFASDALRRKAFVLGANGSARKVKKFLFFKKYPKILSGDEVYVPRVPDRGNKGLTTGEIIGMSTALASLASIIVLVINNLK
jgi:protein involved in polysaccharide export with SLBB domain